MHDVEEYHSRHDLTPPFQPILTSKALDYEERVIQWNMACVKKEALFYRFRTGSDEKARKIDFLPDACVDVLFECCPDDPKATISGLHLIPRTMQLKQDTTYFGFKPYSDRGFDSAKLPFTELVNSSVDLLELLPNAEALLEQLAHAGDLNECVHHFDSFAKKHMLADEYHPSFVDHITLLLCVMRGAAELSDTLKSTGYSERYCRDRFRADHGISPKQYNSTMRFQRTLKQLMLEPETSLTDLAANNGYFDQAHFIHDFKHFTNQSPSRFRKDHRDVCHIGSEVNAGEAIGQGLQER